MHFRMITIFTLGLAAIVQTPNGSEPQKAKPNIADSHTTLELSRKTTLSEAVVTVLYNTGLAGGIVSKEKCEVASKDFYVPAGMPLSQALDKITVTDAHHRWLVTPGGIALIPTDGLPALLQTHIDDIKIKDTNNLTLAVDQITQTTAIKDMISTLKLTLLSQEPGFSQLLPAGAPKPEPRPLSLHDVSLLDALNSIAAEHGSAIWSYMEFACAGKRNLRIEFISR